MQMSGALSALLAAMVSIAVFAAPSEHTKTEIDHLFNYLKSSGCKFNRNGKWYAADAASAVQLFQRLIGEQDARSAAQASAGVQAT